MALTCLDDEYATHGQNGDQGSACLSTGKMAQFPPERLILGSFLAAINSGIMGVHELCVRCYHVVHVPGWLR